MRVARTFKASRHTQQGVSLVELMIAALLGLVVVGGASAVFLSNKRAYGTSETLGRIQEAERASFEIMSRDLREAGGRGCSSSAKLVNQLKNGTNAWWSNYSDGLRGYGAGATPAGGVAIGTAAVPHVAGTDAIDIGLANEGEVRVQEHDNPSANLVVNDTSGFSVGDMLLVCNMDYSFVFEVTQLNSAGGGGAIGGAGIQHNGGGKDTGNHFQELQFTFADDCNSHVPASKDPKSKACGYCFAVADPTKANPNCVKHSNTPATVARATSVRWFIGNNGRGSSSLYRADVNNETGVARNPVEIAEGVETMEIAYLLPGSTAYQAASAVPSNGWSQVKAVRVSMRFVGVRGALSGRNLEGTDGEELSRTLTNVVTLRNREALL